MFGLGFQEIIVILLLALLIFGSKKLPQIGKSIGTSIREFKNAFDGKKKDDDKLDDDEKENDEIDKPKK
ncbi:MAG: twin-arginine translocase TatA/TatE family subunit [Endomicrobiia bacterium]|jgi:TatA/E family protein of Tat protein translocase|nr:twin-arginine translocase TatA/TatE family subunit [Endomicrobiaceae bacterium]MDD3053416.1 twin-arginine translocase TatA/TatE family subunit [Endomicrobiaceae bacterium]MDD3922573.1 twin-arginine translocase TatA/TatE family subunit [Endomicrobiaceae bacterium]MDD5101569.1 twin-arginine translocase TatA/TatE family subunit [Endomicrobiaceae bacterium]